MANPLHMTGWRPWRLLATGSDEDTYIAAGLKESLKPGAPYVIRPTDPAHAILIRGWGQNADNETADIRLSGWGQNGPGQVLCEGDIVLGASGIAEAPFTAPGWAADGTWFEFDTWNLTTNAAGAFAFKGDTQLVLGLPTLGYPTIAAEVKTKDGSTSVEAEAIALAYRFIDAELLHAMITGAHTLTLSA